MIIQLANLLAITPYNKSAWDREGRADNSNLPISRFPSESPEMFTDIEHKTFQNKMDYLSYRSKWRIRKHKNFLVSCAIYNDGER